MAIRVHGDHLIKTLPGLATRPTPSRVRAAVFNIWQSRLLNCRWLDLCSGSGAMAAEALSRGASLAIGIEQSRVACNLIKRNWENIAKPHQTWQIYCGDVVKTLPKLASQPFDLIYFDPPYQSELYLPVLGLLATMLEESSTIAAEHDRSKTLPEQIANLVVVDRRYYGQTALTFYELAQKD